MALDRPDDDFEAGEARLEQHLRSCGPGGDVPAARPEPVEPRTRAEYYEALRAADGAPQDGESADGGPEDGRPGDGTPEDGRPGDGGPEDGGPGDGRPGDDKPCGGGPSGGGPDHEKPANDRRAGEPHVADSRTESSGWDSVDAADRPPVDAIRVSPERRGHILDGEADGIGGGHRHGVGKPGKTEFPANWDDEKIMSKVLDVAQRPDVPPVLQQRNNRWVCTGIRDGVEVSVIVLRSGEVWTAWPEEGSPGVVRNPRKGSHD